MGEEITLIVTHSMSGNRKCIYYSFDPARERIRDKQNYDIFRVFTMCHIVKSFCTVQNFGPIWIKIRPFSLLSIISYKVHDSLLLKLPCCLHVSKFKFTLIAGTGLYQDIIIWAICRLVSPEPNGDRELCISQFRQASRSVLRSGPQTFRSMLPCNKSVTYEAQRRVPTRA